MDPNKKLIDKRKPLKEQQAQYKKEWKEKMKQAKYNDFKKIKWKAMSKADRDKYTVDKKKWKVKK